MAKLKKLIISLIGLITLASIATFAAPTKEANAATTYEIGVGTTFEPYEIEDANGGYKGAHNGFEMDILKAIAKHENFDYNLKIMSFNAMLQAVQSGQIDAMVAGMSVTEERQAKFDFTDAYYNAGAVLAVAKDSKITSFKDLKGKTIGLKVGTTGAQFGESIKDKYGFKVKYFNESHPMWSDVKNGGIDGAMDEEVVLRYGIKNGVKLKVATKAYSTTPIAMAVKKGTNQDFIKKFNSGLAWLKETGKYKEIMDYYIGEKSQVKADTDKDRTIIGLIKKNKDFLLQAIGETLKISIIGIIAATIFGVILGVMGIQKGKVLPGISSTIIYIFRGLPMMVLAFFIYIGLPDVLGHKIPLFTAAIVTLMLNEGSYIGAFVKGGFEAVDVGQWEAARSLGLGYQKTLWKVIAPQGIKIMVPSFLNQFIITIKDTSVLSAIGVMELTQTGSVIISKNMEGFKVWAIIAVIYLIIITALTWLSIIVKKRMN